MHESADRRNRKIQYRAGLEAVEESKHQHEKERAEGGRGDDRAQDQSQNRGDDDHEKADRDAQGGRESRGVPFWVRAWMALIIISEPGMTPSGVL